MKAVLRLCTLALTAGSLAACVSSGSDKADDGAAGGSTSTSTSSTTGGGTPSVCATPVVMTTAKIADFEDYDGATAGEAWNWSFNEDGLGFGGFWLHTDEADDTGALSGDGDYTLGFVAGANGSTYAVSARDSSADTWGGGIAMYVSCLDARAFTGIQFMIMGSTPHGTFDLSLGTPSGDSFGSGDLTVPADWSQVQVAFANMSPAEGSATFDGDGIESVVFSAHLNWVPDPDAPENYIPEPGPFELTVDDISLY